MFEGIDNQINKQYLFPSLENEKGEIERVAELYSSEDTQVFKKKFFESYKKARLTDLSEEVWNRLENTDSYDIQVGDWDAIEHHITHTNETTGAHRDWQDIKEKMKNKKEIDAPIILKHSDSFHLVSGNTRLMVARALGETPKVLIVEIEN